MKFDISKFSQREKNLIGIMLISVATIPLFIQTMPAWQEFNESKSKIQQDSIKLKNLQAQIKKLEQLGKENQELARKVDAQKLYLAKSYEVDFLVQDLKSICDESSVSLESFTPSSPEPINIVLENQISTELAGTSRSSRKTKSVKDKLKGEDLPVDLYRLPIEVRVKGD
ncbi:MAG: type 4a pilus biogenesis protein PilO, partial [Candidatus Melainabacteria bacterium]|nr:type 4a pilus biogenesis protein PilO [Candidatus Melainabacteria bacterium]